MNEKLLGKTGIREVPVALNKKILSMVGGEETDNPKSEKANKEEIIHGLMQRSLFLLEEDGTAPQDSNKVYKADGDRDPNVHMLHQGIPIRKKAEISPSEMLKIDIAGV